MTSSHRLRLSTATYSHRLTISEGHDAADLQLALLQDDINHQLIQSAGHAAADLQLALLPEDINHQPIQTVVPNKSKKRKSRKRPTPVVDDEVKSSTRLHKIPGFEHMELDEKSKPRKLAKEDTALM